MAVRPLRLDELAEVLALDFNEAPEGIPLLNADWRREDLEHAVLSTCSSLITVIHDRDLRMVQFSHFSVKEFLTSDRLASGAGDTPFHHIAPAPAHTILAQACLGVLLRLDDTTWETFVQRFPLANYAIRYWADHALFENVSLRIKDGIEDLFDLEKPHFSRWIRIQDVDDNYGPLHETGPEHLAAAPLYYSAFCGFPEVLEKLIVEHPELVNAPGGPCGTALHAASRRNHLNIVQLLLTHGADVNALGMWGRTPLIFASVLGHLEVVRWLLEHGADVNAKDNRDETSLHLATHNEHFEVIQTLLKHNADTNARDGTGWTPLHITPFYGRVDIARLLLNRGADPKARDTEHQTPLHKASSEGHLDSVHLLLEHGADVEAKDDKGRTAYQIALDQGHDKVVQLLLAHGAESKT